jgi:hypothetical protein
MSFKKLRLDRDGLTINGAGINLKGLMLLLVLAVIVILTDHRRWEGFIVLGLIPLVMVYASFTQEAGISLPRVPTVLPEKDQLWQDDGKLNLDLLEANLEQIRGRALTLRPAVHSGTCTGEEQLEARILLGILREFDPNW